MPMMPEQKPGSSRQDYETPEDLIRAVKRRLAIREFAIDLAAESSTAKAVNYVTKEDDALSISWALNFPASWPKYEWAWLNPPFAKIEPWLEKAATCGRNVAVLIPASVGANYWAKWVHDKALVLLLNGRITFEGELDPYPKDCVLLLYSPDIGPGYQPWRWTEVQ